MTRIPVQVTGQEHPHFGCRGHIKVSENDTVTVHHMFGKRVVLVDLNDCQHGTEGCYAEQAALTPIPEFRR